MIHSPLELASKSEHDLALVDQLVEVLLRWLGQKMLAIFGRIFQGSVAIVRRQSSPCSCWYCFFYIYWCHGFIWESHWFLQVFVLVSIMLIVWSVDAQTYFILSKLSLKYHIMQLHYVKIVKNLHLDWLCYTFNDLWWEDSCLYNWNTQSKFFV